MNFLFFILFLIDINCLSQTDFSKVMTDLENLEKYMRNYIQEKSPSQTLTHLITCYIREGAYSTTEWSIVGGSIPDDLVQYIIDKDASEGTNAQACKTYREIDLPNKEKIDFVHFFAVMNGIENGKSYSSISAHLVGWGGDTFQLLQDIKNESGNLEELMDVAKTYFRLKGGFGPADFVSDLDAPIILNKKKDDNNFSELLKNYYNSEEYIKRVDNFKDLTFPDLKEKDKFREEIFKIYSSNLYISILECKDGLREQGFLGCNIPGEIKSQYVEHQKAAVYVVSDYISENYAKFSSALLLKLPFISLLSILYLIL